MDRLGICSILIAPTKLFFFLFPDALLDFQCSVTDFLMMKCNRFERTSEGASSGCPLHIGFLTRLKSLIGAAPFLENETCPHIAN